MLEIKPIEANSVAPVPRPSVVGFDYESVNNDTGDRLKQAAEEIRALQRKRADIQKIKADLLDQGVTLFPPTKTGERARFLWRMIKPHLLRGDTVEVTVSALHLDLHREELKRARAVLVEMGLIKPRAEGRYVLGSLGPCSRIDELLREEFYNLKLLESVVLALGAITKSKTRNKRGRLQASEDSQSLRIRCHG